MSAIQILHNPRCSKSRQTLALLEAQGIQPEIQLYLEQTPSVAELQAIIAKLGISVSELVRSGEADYKDNQLKNADDKALLEAMVQFPKLIQRPIVINGDKAAIGRPPESVLDIL